MKKVLLLVLFLVLALFGCNGSGSSSNDQKSFLHERQLAADPSLAAGEDQVVAVFLEHPDHTGPLEGDTGGIGQDLIPYRFARSVDREFSLVLPDGQEISVSLFAPSGERLFSLSKDTPRATVDLEAGIHIFDIEHGAVRETNRALFIRPGQTTVIGYDCPNQNMAGTDFRFHNLSGADLSCSDLSGADLSYADLSNTDLRGADYQDAKFLHSDVTGMNASCGGPQNCSCTNQTEVGNCFFIAPAVDCNKFGDRTIISFFSCQQNGTNPCPVGVTVTNGSIPQCLVFPDQSLWKISIENSHWREPYYGIVKTDSNGWQYASPCDQPGAADLDICSSVAIFDPSPDQRRFGPGCILHDTSVTSYPLAYLLDQKNGNLLYRGSVPCVSEKDNSNAYRFDFDNLLARLQDLHKAQLQGKSAFPTTFRFIDISLINDAGEKPMLMAEYAAFGGNGTVPPTNSTVPATGFHQFNSTVEGQFRWWNMLPDANGQQGANASDIGGLVDWIAMLMNSTVEGTPYVIYFHCDGGVDRTGEVATSYLLKHRGMSPEQAFVYGTTTFANQGNESQARSRSIPNHDYLAGAIWYCRQLCPTGNCDYNTMDQSTVPVSTAYPCPYPWSSGQCDWGTSCDR